MEIRVPIDIIIDPIYYWQTIVNERAIIAVKGDCRGIQALIDYLLNFKQADDQLEVLLRRLPGHCSLIFQSRQLSFACVDRIRSYPIYYHRGDSLAISNSALALKNRRNLQKFNEQSVLEFSMSGYVYGQDTLYQDLEQLQAGEYCLQLASGLVFKRYYQYVPKPDHSLRHDDLIEQHGKIVDQIMTEIMAEANGDPIWVPLSAGLDSRMILAKLVELGYDNIQAFSYGVKGNFEAVAAKKIAKKLGVPWFSVYDHWPLLREEQYLTERKNYTEYAHGYNTIPGYVDFKAFYQLKNKGLIPSNAIVINGQTGDFISGGHVPLALGNQSSLDDMIKCLISKHISLWNNLKTPENIAAITDKVVSQLPDVGSMTSYEQLCSQYESWEWQERQAKMIVNAQRVYDYFNLRWRLPLWDSRLMNFWQSVPFEEKKKQKLLVDYLRAYNFRGVFSPLRYEAKPWSTSHKWIPVMARLIGVVAGRQAKDRYYRYMYYYSSDRSLYQYFGRQCYINHYKNARNVTSLMAKDLLDSLGMPLWT